MHLYTRLLLDLDIDLTRLLYNAIHYSSRVLIVVPVVIMLKPYLELLRLPNSLLSGLGAGLVILAYSNYRAANPAILLVAFITGFTLTSSSMIINDIVDTRVDSINKPWKPIPRGAVNPGKAGKLAITLLTMGIIVNVTYPHLLVTAVVYGAMGAIYNYMRKHAWSHILVAASTTGPIVYGYIAAETPGKYLYFTITYVLVILLVTLGREYLKAIQDVHGDKIYGYSTIATKLGLEKTWKVTIITGLTGAILGESTIIIYAGETSTLYKTLITTAAVIYTYSLLKAYRDKRKETIEKTRKTTLIAMFIGMASLWLLTIPF